MQTITHTLFQGRSLCVLPIGEDDERLVELRFDAAGQHVNKFDVATLEELRQAVRWLSCRDGLRGVLVSSAKDAFIVGGDITEFPARFTRPEDELLRSLWRDNEVFMAFEDLPVPSVAALNGYALGGGCEMALTAAYRVMADDARIGVPEVKLGLFPGLGGLVRLPRVAGPQRAIDWVADGEAHAPEAAQAAGVIDLVCPPAALRAQALAWLRRAAAGQLDWRTRQSAKRAPVPLPPAELEATFRQARERLAARDQPLHQPAARMAVQVMEASAGCSRDTAQWMECEAFVRVARTQAGQSLVRAFMDDQAVKRLARQRAAGVSPPLRVAFVDLPPLPAPRTPKWLVCEPASADLLLCGPLADASALAAIEAQAAASASIACTVPQGVEALAAAAHRPQALIGWQDQGDGLTEVLPGPASDDRAIARMVAFASARGRTPLLVRGGSLVGRLRSAGVAAVSALQDDGAAAPVLARALQDAGWSPTHWRLPPADPAVTAHASTAQPIADRLVLALVVAAARLLDDGAVSTAAEIDVACRLGLGWPAYLGGPLQHADWLGLPQLVERCTALAVSHGPLYRPPDGLLARAAARQNYFPATRDPR